MSTQKALLVSLVVLLCGNTVLSCSSQTFDERVDNILSDVLPALGRLCSVSFEKDQIPKFVEITPSNQRLIIRRQDPLEEYLLYHIMGGIGSDYDSYAAEMDRRNINQLGFYDDRSHSIWIHSDSDDRRLYEVLAHELTHAWIAQEQPSWRRVRPQQITDNPDAYLAGLGIEEGLAIECTSRYRQDKWDSTYRNTDMHWFAFAEDDRDTKVIVDEQTFYFIDRASRWVQLLAAGFREQFLDDAIDIGTILHESELSEIQTSLLLDIREAEQNIQFGSLLLREALILNGVSWPNAEAITRSVLYDDFKIVEDSQGRRCSFLRVAFDNSASFPARWLSPLDAMSKWAVSSGIRMDFEGDNEVQMSECLVLHST